MNNETLLYLYFDALEMSVKSRIDDMTSRLIRSTVPITYNELAELLSLTAKQEIIKKIELDINNLLFYDNNGRK